MAKRDGRTVPMHQVSASHGWDPTAPTADTSAARPVSPGFDTDSRSPHGGPAEGGASDAPSVQPSVSGDAAPGAGPAAPPVDELERARAQVAGRSFDQPSQPVRIGAYVVDVPMGEGATGVVYRAHDEQLRRPVALKVLHASVAQTPRHRERLVREARAMATLTHPNVAVVHEVGEHDGRLFIAMELLEGGTLGAWAKARPRDWRSVLKVLIATGRGLEAAHARGLVHRDLKPDNVLLGADGRPRIVDFGLVGSHETAAATPNPSALAAETTPAAHELALTAAGALLGTPAYMAPEQMMGMPADARSDQFSFCATAYEVLFGQRPFRAGTFLELVNAVTNGHVTPPPPERKVPTLVTKAILRGLEVEPGRRHPSMTDLLAILQAALGTGRGVKAVAIIASVAFVAVAGGASFSWWSTEQAKAEERAKKARLAAQVEEISELYDNGKHQDCVDYALEAEPIQEVLAQGYTCAISLQDHDRLQEICDRWLGMDDVWESAEKQSCHPATLDFYELSAKQQWTECVERLKGAPDNEMLLGYKLICAGAALDTKAYARLCEKMNAEFPKNPSAKACKVALGAMGGAP